MIQTKGNHKVLQNSESEELNNIEANHPALVEPQDLAIDGIKLVASTSRQINAQDRIHLQRLLQSQGIKCLSRFPGEREAEVRTSVIMKPLPAFLFQPIVYGSGNGILAARKEMCGEDAIPLTIDGRKNAFVSEYNALNCSAQMQNVQNRMGQEVTSAMEQIRSHFWSKAKIETKFKLTLVHGEFCHHQYGPAENASLELSSFFRAMRVRLSKTGIKPYSKKNPMHLVYGFLPEDNNMMLVVYQKLNNCIRMEIQFNKKEISVGTMEEIDFQSELQQTIQQFRIQAALVLNDILQLKVPAVKFPEHEVFANYLRLTSKKGGPALLKKLELGDGTAKVLSRHVAEYRDARKLVNEGWMVKLDTQSTYYLLPEFRGLLSFGSVMDRFLDSTKNQKGEL